MEDIFFDPYLFLEFEKEFDNFEKERALINLNKKSKTNFNKGQKKINFWTLSSKIKDYNPNCIAELEYYIRDFFEIKDFKKNFFFYGNTGVGKTYLTLAFANEFVKRGYTAFFTTGLKYLGNITDKSQKKAMLNKQILIIDDLSKQNNSYSFYISALFEILEERKEKNLLTIITDNLSIDDIFFRWKLKVQNEDLMPLLSRMKGYFNEYEILGEDLRR